MSVGLDYKRNAKQLLIKYAGVTHQSKRRRENSNRAGTERETPP
jgi:hypothetical protein